MHAEQETAVIDLQIQVLNHLAKKAPQLTLPRVIAGTNSELIQSAEINGRTHLIWLLTYVEGSVYADANPQTADLRHSFGSLLGQVDAALADFEHPASKRDLKWNLTDGGWIRNYLHAIPEPERLAIVEKFLNTFETAVYPKLTALRQSVIHNDANDYNTLVSNPLPHPRTVISLIDFGDTLYSQTINNLAIATAYAIMGQPDPLVAAADVVAGYHEAYPLTEQEIELLFNLICMRLCVSVVNSGIRKQEAPDDPYVVISERPAWDVLEKLDKVHPRLAHYLFRSVCGFTAVPHETAVRTHLEQANPAQMLDLDLRTEPLIVLDLSVSSLWLTADPDAMNTPNLSVAIEQAMTAAGCEVSVGRYDEVRLLYSNDLFATGTDLSTERRTVHVGLDLFAPADTKLYAPLDGRVHIVANNNAPLDYGPVLILEHETDDGIPFYTLYGHLAESLLGYWNG